MTAATPATAATGNPADRSAKPLAVAVIGDVLYGTAQEATVGQLVHAVNGEPKVRFPPLPG